MSNKNFQVYFDCGSSKIRAGSFNNVNSKEFFFKESQIFFDHTNIDFEIQKIVSFLEENTNEYLDSINLMIDSPKMLFVGISISKKLGENDVSGLNANTVKPLSFKLDNGIVSKSPCSSCPINTCQSTGILIVLFPISNTTAGALNDSKKMSGM